jgi:hypothetical protein
VRVNAGDFPKIGIQTQRKEVVVIGEGFCQRFAFRRLLMNFT